LIKHDITRKQVDDHFFQGVWSLMYNIHGYPENKDEFGCEGIDFFGYDTEFKEINHTDNTPLIPDEVAVTLSKNPGNTRLLVHSKASFSHDGEKTNYPERWMRQRIMQKPQTRYIKLTIYTIGNFRRYAGEIINIMLPSPEEQKGKMDRRLRGRYIVTSVRRIFKPSRHECVMEVVKDSFAG